MRVILAEDSTAQRGIIKQMLSQLGYGDVVEAVDGVEAWEHLCSEPFELLLTDWNMPRMSGLELLEKIRQLDPELPIIVMTAWGTVGLAVAAMQAGASDFIEKPWDNERLLSVLRNQLALADSQRRGNRLAEENRVLKASAEDSDLIAESAAPTRNGLRRAMKIRAL